MLMPPLKLCTVDMCAGLESGGSIRMAVKHAAGALAEVVRSEACPCKEDSIV